LSIISLVKKVFSFMGIDRAIVYTLAGRGWGLFSGVVMLLLVVRYLTPDEQGYYYTFASILAMQIFFELGMSYVVMQFASHEMAHLTWSEAGTVEGDANAKNRLHSLLLLVTKWYGVIAALLIVAILPVGWIFFSASHAHSGVNWQSAWVWLVLAAAVNVFIMPLLALLEGCGRVTEVARLRMYQNMIGSLLAWTVLVGGGGLLAVPAMNAGLALTVLVWLWRTKRVFFKSLFVHKMAGDGIKWKTEIWPFQWKIALSWLSGYFIFQLFTPVLFAYRGAVEAGQMGMSIAIANALMSIAMAWMNTKVPGFGALVAKRDYINLDRVFSFTLSRSLGVMVIGGGLLCALNYFIHVKHVQFVDRVLDPVPFTFLMLATTLNYVTYAQAAYLRAHKEEPFMLISLVSAALIGVFTFAWGGEYGATGIMSGYLAVCGSVGFGWGSLIFFSKRREWQKQCALEVPRKGML
jgi:O-antigen/teichoic acid export membrane protein